MPSAVRRRRAAQEEESDDDRRQSTQRQRRRAPASDDESEEEAEAEAEDGMDVDAAEGDDQMVKKLVRYALACEYQRVVIRRAGISDIVMGKQRGAYKRVFKAAQEQLQNVFGMEMVELPVREKITIKEKRAAAKTKGNSKPTSSYILTSILPIEYRTPEIMPPSIISSQEDEATYIGLYTMIVAMIALNPGGTIPDHKLNSYLKRMNIDENTPLEKTTLLLARMIKQGYIIKSVDKSAEEETIDWRVGPRGKVEIANKGVSGLIQEVYGDDAPEDLEKRIHRSLGIDAASAERERNNGGSGQDESMADGDPGPSAPRPGRRRQVAAEDEDDD